MNTPFLHSHHFPGMTKVPHLLQKMSKRSMLGMLCLVGFLIGIQASQAVTVTKANNTTALNLVGSWGTGSGPVPTSSDIALWDSTVTGNKNTAMGADLSFGGIRITGALGVLTISGTQTLTLGASGIDMSTASTGLRFQDAASTIVLGANQTWNVAAGRLLRVSSIVTGTNQLTLAGSGTNYLENSANNYSGGTIIDTGANVQINSSAALTTVFGTGTVTIRNGSTLSGFTSGNRSVTNNIVLEGNTTIGRNDLPLSNFSLSGDLDIGNGVRTISILNASAPAQTNTALIFNGSNKSITGVGGELILANGNTGTGAQPIFVRLGNTGFSVNTTLTIGTNVTLYMPTANVLGTGADLNLQSGATLDLSNKINTATDQVVRSLSGSGTVTNMATLGVSTLTVNGGTSTAVSTYAGNMVSNSATTSIALTKQGASTLVLSGSNNYTGATTVTGGALRLDSANALSANSNLNINGGVVELGAGNTSFTRSTGTAAGNVRFTESGGFGAVGADATVNLNGGAAITWGGTGSTANFLTATQELILSSANSNHKVTWQNALNLNGGTRTVNVNNGSAAVDAEISGPITGAGSTSIFVKNGAGALTLSGTNTYVGATTVNAGTLIVGAAGSLASSAVNVVGGQFVYNNNTTAYAGNVAVNGSLGGSGKIAGQISGSGLVGPGNSPGILTAGSVNTASGLDFAFEFTSTGSPTYGNNTASVNDVLRLTGGTPFSTALTADNSLNIYLNVVTLNDGDIFRGGFYTDNSADFLASVSDATFVYYIADAGGSVLYGGNTYSLYSGPFDFDVSTVASTANFGDGSVNGYVMEFAAVPEPQTWVLLGLGLMTLVWRSRLGRRASRAQA